MIAPIRPSDQSAPLRVAGLFAGIGGFELGFSRAGHQTTVLVENWAPARAVLAARFPGVPCLGDVRDVTSLPRDTDVLTAGFPCQDLSSVGPKVGIRGSRSSLVSEVFRLIRESPPRWLVLENVPFLLQLDKGRALKRVAEELWEAGYAWAYRVVDAMAFGLPQRRRRWYLVASRTHDPRGVLLEPESGPPAESEGEDRPCGFYWTEGFRALGWTANGVPPLKGGSTVGVASPPAILLASGEVVTPDIRDAERLQGFPSSWTRPAESVAKPGFRWQLVGNAVAVGASTWLGRRLCAVQEFETVPEQPLSAGAPWPLAAWSTRRNVIHASSRSAFPVRRPVRPLGEFLRYEPKPLSARAARGFLSRTKRAQLRFRPGFLEAIEAHARTQEVDL